MTDRYAVIGNPIAHSKSPEIHAAFARQLGHEISYERLFSPTDQFALTLKALRQSGALGANVTSPFKIDAFDCATERSTRAITAGAANTLRFVGEEIFADNTDGVGLTRDIRDNLQFSLTGKRILLLGAGGAARGVVEALLAAQPTSLMVTNRTAEKADMLVEKMRVILPNALSGAVFEAVARPKLAQLAFDLVINATTASLTHELPPIPSSVFAKDALAYDMTYGKGLTPFLSVAASHGARTADGLGMLVEQAAEAFLIWRGERPQTGPVIAKLRQALAGIET
jgi:shikimate dehydrogenase